MNAARSQRGAAICALAAGLFAGVAGARVIAVYSRQEASPSFSDLKAAAASLRDAPAGKTSDDRFDRVVQDGPVLSADLSIGPGVTAYFWSDQPYVMDPDFGMAGTSMSFECDLPVSGELSKKAASPSYAATTLNDAVLQGSLLNLDYSLSKAGPVSAAVFGANGRSLGRWTWNEGASGSHSRVLELKAAPRSGTVFVQWKSGDAHIVRSLSVR